MNIKAISPIDGRYSDKVKVFNEIFSEYGLIKHRFEVEIKWLKFILKDLKLENINQDEINLIEKIYKNFNENSALRIKETEKTTNHDVKAIEYFIKEELEKNNLSHFKEWVHFALTSEDINNTAYSLMFKKGISILKNDIESLLNILENKAKNYKNIPMLARTHGQAASPTTTGKELINFSFRIRRELKKLKNLDFEAKLNGATGNYSAMYFAFPNINWPQVSSDFIKKQLSLTPNIFTTQINNYNYISEMFQVLIRICATLNDLNRDIWSYISLGYFKQKIRKGEIGSSTMPHKVNPIDFENSEGNLGIAISLMQHFSVKLLISRYQRDLSDSTVLRNSGVIFSHIKIALESTIKGLNKLEINEKRLFNELKNNYELLAEPIQTIMRVYKEESPYEKLKELTRGKKINQNDLATFTDSLSLPEKVKEKLKKLTPETYTGLAEDLVDIYFSQF